MHVNLQPGMFVVMPAEMLEQLQQTAPPTSPTSPKRRSRVMHATRQLRATLNKTHLLVQFADGLERRFPLPARNDVAAIRAVRQAACDWAAEGGATDGQFAAIKKALTGGGFYLQGPQQRRS
jgi:hypothetical protein